MKVFADTGYWIAFLNPADTLHRSARRLAAQKMSIVTTEMVLAELLNDFGSRGVKYRKLAANFVQGLPSRPNIAVIPQSTQQFWSAVQLYLERLDKKWSLTDCASYAVMEELGLRDALTYDRHFVQMGFRSLLRESRPDACP